jgi:exodeoxyribonuclease V alpha subunit
VLILDECSMVDVLLWRAMLDALPKDARLILLGDPNQLESVGHGNVFGELARIASKKESPLHSSHVHLTATRRFKDRPGILAFAQALENFDADSAVALLEDANGPQSGLQWLPTTGGALSYESFPETIQASLAQVAGADTPDAALAALSKVCILTAQREFFVGAKATSSLIDLYFSRHPQLGRNRPIIINHNDPDTGLRNGSVGVIHTDANGVRKAWFPAMKGKLQEFSVARLPDHSPAWAITIHRSQGSEFDDVLVVLPQKESPMATRELLYTAITRAKRNVIIVGDIETVRIAATTRSNRQTLLAFHLENHSTAD